jgi:4-alpha-glucanotransferase
MRRAGYAWWRQRARQARELYDLFRVDHVVGLYRTYAIPVRAGGTSGFVPASEDEQRIQGYELMSALREEAGTACGVIAEDLGTVPRWVRESLTQLGIPGYKVFRWERHDGDFIDPRSYPALSVATTGTHDTESLAEWWETLSDDLRVGTLRSLDLEHGEARQIQCAPQRTADLHLALLRRLYEAGSALTIIPIQDLLGWRERINVPATTDAQNWTYRLPVTIDDLDQTPAIRERMEVVSTMIDQSGRNPELTARMMG